MNWFFFKCSCKRLTLFIINGFFKFLNIELIYNRVQNIKTK